LAEYAKVGLDKLRSARAFCAAPRAAART